MKPRIRLMVMLLIGAVALSGCAALRSLLSGDAGPADSPAPDVVKQPSAPLFTFFDSWASW
ncbi:MAG: hypothetical protein OXN88_03970 [Chloroflexota bacterium]|nr:hypothetical protein [Chloroflexota bacterium]